MTRSSLAVGRVARPHGVRGELKVQLYWPESTSLLAVKEVVLVPSEGAPRTCAVQAVRPTPRAQLLKVAGIDDVAAAEGLRGAEVRVRRAELPPLEPGAYYLADLVGARVVGPAGEVGVVVEVRPYPTVDCVVVEDESGRRREQPLVEPWVCGVDAAAGVIELMSLDGFLD
ncbi:MAG TPA: ribosome maturation factor RimM [Polyangiaceae bacterium]|nr:ribosome maturation factor RimM [Polyangiaceae bacterium]